MQRNRFLPLIALAIALLQPSPGLRAGTALYNPAFQGAAQSDLDLGGHTLKNVAPGGSIVKSALGCGPNATFLFEGDSITYGQYLSNPATQRYSTLFASLSFASAATAVRNDAVSGSAIADVAGRYAANVYPHRTAAKGGDGGTTAYLVLMIGTNDVSNGTAAPAMLAALSAYTTQARTDGFTVVLATILPASRNATAAARAAYEAYNAAIRTGQVPCDFVWDANIALPNPADTALYPDNLHPSATGHLALANSLNSQLLAGGHTPGTQPTLLPGNVMNVTALGTPAYSFWYPLGGIYQDALDFMFNPANSQPNAGVPWIFSDQFNLCLNSADGAHAVKLQDATHGRVTIGPIADDGSTPLQVGGSLKASAAAFTGTVSASAFSGSGSGLAANTIPLSALSSSGATSGTVATFNGTSVVWSAPAVTGYLPLAGGTLTGSLSGTSAAFSGAVTATPYVAVNGLITNYVSGMAMYGSNGGGVLIESGGSTNTAYVNYYSHAPVQICPNGGSVTFGNGGVTVGSSGSGSLTVNGHTTSGSIYVADATLAYNPGYVTYGSSNGSVLIESADSSHAAYINFFCHALTAINPNGGNILIGTGSNDGTHLCQIAGDIATVTAGATLSVKSGTNALAGTVSLSSGTATITSSAIDTNTVIVLSVKTASGTPGTFMPRTSVGAGSATVTGASTDTSTYNWVAFKVN